MAVEFSGKKVAALGGDRRQYWFVEEALKAGLAVNGIGLPPEVDKLIGKPQANSVGDALEGVDAVLFPIPRLSSRRDGSLYSDYEPFPLFVGEDELSRAKKGAALVLGYATDELRSNAKKLGMNLVEYSDDDILAIQNSIPTAEGAISYTIKNTDECFPTLKCMIIGFGRIAVTLARDLRRLGAEVWVAARRREVRARILQMGLHPVRIEEYFDLIEKMDVIYQTAPALMLPEEGLKRVRPDALVIELASPPGGSDFKAAEKHGVRLIWARAQAGTAPKAAGRWMWQLNARYLREHWKV